MYLPVPGFEPMSFVFLGEVLPTRPLQYSWGVSWVKTGPGIHIVTTRDELVLLVSVSTAFY